MQALWMILASLLFASMGVCVKFASSAFNSAELIFYRGLIGVVFLGALARTRGISLATRFPGMHAWRSLIGVMSLGAWFYALAHLPLATAMTLNYMSSVWIAAFLVGGSLLLGRVQKQGPLVLTVMLGFVGVVLMLRPTFDHHQAFAGLLGLLSGMSAAFAYMQVMALSRLGEPETRVVFYFSVGSVVAGAAGMMAVGISPWVWPSALWLIPVGVLASLGQLCMTRAYSHGATLVVANLQYSGIVFGAIYSVALFGDHIELMGWAGMGLIVISGIAATVLREHAVPHAPAEEH
ncbi:DMT family transporter [Polaromonas sp. C04]|uniref:DMT family transporter n=1 Tax=Polaromonas sp. C04 TaxID=1945857 RepID=UPI0009851F69|nr:DMT family transporter [Polaromonas sp. C04]OOG58918.1 EamA family transporter [Polaromonas sp. C04]